MNAHNMTGCTLSIAEPHAQLDAFAKVTEQTLGMDQVICSLSTNV